VTPEEQRLLADLARKISQTPPPQRDPEAEDFIRKNIGSRPDALYLMTQTVLIQNMAIQQAQQQIHDLQQRAQQQAPVATGSFLGGSQAPPPPQYSQQPAYAAPQSSQSYAPPPPGLGFGQGSSGPGFLRSAAQTAAGVAAGALAFEGIRSMFSHPGFGLGGGFGMGQAGFMGGAGLPMEETVVNNYYDSPREGAHHAEHLVDTSDDNSDNQSDVADNDDNVKTQNVDYDDSNDADDSSSFDDSSSDVA